tara:strand:- start:280 stop:537 length:258 start_codon:yes stop_codon:yes gene_type:complete
MINVSRQETYPSPCGDIHAIWCRAEDGVWCAWVKREGVEPVYYQSFERAVQAASGFAWLLQRGAPKPEQREEQLELPFPSVTYDV